MPQDPMTSYEQAEAEADERFYEERDDKDAAEQYWAEQHARLEAQRDRRRALWNRHCIGGHSSPDMCPCIQPCASCGHLAAQHELTEGHRTHVIQAGECEVNGCTCGRFVTDDDD